MINRKNDSGENTCRRGDPQHLNTPHPSDLYNNLSSITVACFVDWENIRKLIFHNCSLKIDYNTPDNLFTFFNAFLLLNESFYRIFIYLSEPLSSVKWHGKTYDMTGKPAYKKSRSFIDKISKKDLIAVRKGKLKVRDVKTVNNEVRIFPVQKQVDMLMGLDVAHVAYKRLADRILMFSYDSDIVPALKTARINGLQVIVAECPDIKRLDDDLKKHADFVRSKKFRDIFQNKHRNI